MAKRITSTSVYDHAGQHDKHRVGTRVVHGWLSALGRNLLMEGYSAMLANQHGLKCQTFFAERGHKVKANLVDNDNLV